MGSKRPVTSLTLNICVPCNPLQALAVPARASPIPAHVSWMEMTEMNIIFFSEGKDVRNGCVGASSYYVHSPLDSWTRFPFPALKPRLARPRPLLLLLLPTPSPSPPPPTTAATACVPASSTDSASP